MGQVSHTAADIRQIVRDAPRPPTKGGPCSGTRFLEGRWTTKHDANGDPVRKPNGGKWDYERIWVEGEEVPCGNSASIWLPEAGYCAHHLPFALMPIANARAELWALLCHDIWAQVCAEYSLPEES
jgi:hypothetical protein